QTKLKELKDFHDFRLPYIEEAVQLLNNEIAKVEKAKADSALFQYAPLDVDQDEPQGGPSGQPSEETLAAMKRLANDLAGFQPADFAANKLRTKAEALIRSQVHNKALKTLSASVSSVIRGVDAALGAKTPRIDEAKSHVQALPHHVTTARDALPAEAKE